jgi:sensor c-di-GMP phosphodiesterase-like protein
MDVPATKSQHPQLDQPIRSVDIGHAASAGVGDSSGGAGASTVGSTGESGIRPRSLAAFFGAQDDASDGAETSRTDRTRALSLHLPRVLFLALGSAGLAAATASAMLWAHLDQTAHREAASALQFVDDRLTDIESSMRLLAEQAAVDSMWSVCAPPLASLLARASIASDYVQRFELSIDGYANSCRPEGRAVAPLYEHAAGGRLALTSSGEILARATATLHVDANGHIIGAVLDPRAFEPEPGQADSWLFSSTSRLQVVSGDGKPLSVLGVDRGPSPVPPVHQVLERSANRSVAVTAEIERSTFVHLLQRWIPTAIAVAWLLVLGAVAFTWRRAQLRSRLYHRIARGLRRREFEPFVQPIMDLRTGHCAGAEVLMRWAHPQRGVLGPAEFIEEAERTGLIVGMSDLVMTRAAHRLGPIAERFPELYFSFNLTPQQLALSHLPKRLSEIFRADTLPPDRVLLELTEREFVDPLAMNSLRALQDGGWRVAIDDFGTGHSSLASLERMTIDRLKIDRAFVSTIHEETVNRPVLDSIIQLADRLSLPMIAEGIETQAQWDYLAERGVQYAQGYLIGRPMPIAAFLEWLSFQDHATPTSVEVVDESSTAEMPIPDVAAQHLWNAMRTPGGLDIRDRMFRLRTYSQCFVGREAVDWLVQQHRVSRADAVRMGQHLSALGLLSHVLDEHDFEDAELFYRLASPRGASLVAGPAAAGLRSSLRGSRGVPLREHTRGLMRHRDCATGRSIVNWIASTRQVSRETATRWALQLMREGALRHVYDDTPFRDDRTLYRVA